MEKIKIKWNEIIAPLVGAALSLLIGLLSAYLTKDSMNIASWAKQPPFSPPAWLFPIVWTLLYALMGIGAGVVYNRRDRDADAVRGALLTFLFQLAINFLWSIVFFHQKALLLACILLAVLLASVIRMTVQFWRIDPLAGKIQIPYILWLAFALYLNVGFVVLNGIRL